MPRPRHAQGRPNTVVIPADWEATHAAVVARTYDCTIVVGAAGGTPQWNEAAKATLTPPVAAVYSGAASITPVEQDSDQQPTVAEDVVPLGGYQVKIQHGAEDVRVGHVVVVTTAPDPMLTGQSLKVTAIEKGSRRFSRILYAVDAD